MQTIFDQLISFLITMGIGILAAIFYDIYRVIRSLWQPRKLGTWIGDFVFWIILTIMVFALLLFGNWGELRIYVFLGIIIGYLIYMKKCTKKGQRIIRQIFIVVIKTLRYIWWVCTWPFKMIYKIVLIPLGFVTAGFLGLAKISKQGYGKIIGKLNAVFKRLLHRQPKDDE